MTDTPITREAVEQFIAVELTDLYRSEGMPLTDDDLRIIKLAANKLRALRDELDRVTARVAEFEAVLRIAEAALADIGDADREDGDDLAWCERRAAEALPSVRAALRTDKGDG